MYYSLHSFYQNHKRYVRSRNDAQLAGKTKDPSVKCQPEEYLGGNAKLPINPCGLIAWSLFNDTFSADVIGPSGAQSTPLSLNVRFSHLLLSLHWCICHCKDLWCTAEQACVYIYICVVCGVERLTS